MPDDWSGNVAHYRPRASQLLCGSCRSGSMSCPRGQQSSNIFCEMGSWVTLNMISSTVHRAYMSKTKGRVDTIVIGWQNSRNKRMSVILQKRGIHYILRWYKFWCICVLCIHVDSKFIWLKLNVMFHRNIFVVYDYLDYINKESILPLSAIPNASNLMILSTRLEKK